MIIQERDGMAWTRVVLVEVLRSSEILDIFEEKSQSGLLTDWTWSARLERSQRLQSFGLSSYRRLELSSTEMKTRAEQG